MASRWGAATAWSTKPGPWSRVRRAVAGVMAAAGAAAVEKAAFAARMAPVRAAAGAAAAAAAAAMGEVATAVVLTERRHNPSTKRLRWSLFVHLPAWRGPG